MPQTMGVTESQTHLSNRTTANLVWAVDLWHDCYLLASFSDAWPLNIGEPPFNTVVLVHLLTSAPKHTPVYNSNSLGHWAVPEKHLLLLRRLH